MKKLLLLSALLIFACSSDDSTNSNDCTIITEETTDITPISAVLNGSINYSQNCDIPNNDNQGFVYSKNFQPTTEDTQVNVNGTSISIIVENLDPDTTYYVRAFITNALGDFYGNEMNFRTDEVPDLLDCNGNLVPEVELGNYVWATVDACHTTYRDGTPIPEVPWSEMVNLTTGAWSYITDEGETWYPYDPPIVYKVYNFYALAGVHDTASFSDQELRKDFAPIGWRVAGYEWSGLSNANASSIASTSGWYESSQPGSPGYDQSNNNSTGFNLIPTASWVGAPGLGYGAAAERWMNSITSLGFAYGVAYFFRIGNNNAEPNEGWVTGYYPYTGMNVGMPVRLVKDQ